MSDDDQRPSKRRRTVFSPAPIASGLALADAVSLADTSPRLTFLNELNDLSLAEFQQRYLPNHLMAFCPAKRPDLTITFTFHTSTSISPADFRKCFDLLRQTSKSHYAFSSLGWVPQAKKAEMKDKLMKYILVHCDGASFNAPSPDRYYNPREEALKTFGYMSFQLLADQTLKGNTIPVLYLYELHLGSLLRTLGIGTYLMRMAEHIAQQTSMRKIMLTVFNANEHAEAFYRQRGFTTDETSPTSLRQLRRGKIVPCDYKILSLRVPPAFKVKKRIGVQRIRTSPAKRLHVSDDDLL